jgi:hypothetical protein
LSVHQAYVVDCGAPNVVVSHVQSQSLNNVAFFSHEVAMIERWMGMTIGVAALLIAIPLVISHYRREYRRGQLLRNLDHVEWWYRPRGPK